MLVSHFGTTPKGSASLSQASRELGPAKVLIAYFFVPIQHEPESTTPTSDFPPRSWNLVQLSWLATVLADGGCCTRCGVSVALAGVLLTVALGVVALGAGPLGAGAAHADNAATAAIAATPDWISRRRMYELVTETETHDSHGRCTQNKANPLHSRPR